MICHILNAVFPAENRHEVKLVREVGVEIETDGRWSVCMGDFRSQDNRVVTMVYLGLSSRYFPLFKSESIIRLVNYKLKLVNKFRGQLNLVQFYDNTLPFKVKICSIPI